MSPKLFWVVSLTWLWTNQSTWSFLGLERCIVGPDSALTFAPVYQITFFSACLPVDIFIGASTYFFIHRFPRPLTSSCRPKASYDSDCFVFAQISHPVHRSPPPQQSVASLRQNRTASISYYAPCEPMIICPKLGSPQSRDTISSYPAFILLSSTTISRAVLNRADEAFRCRYRRHKDAFRVHSAAHVFSSNSKFPAKSKATRDTYEQARLISAIFPSTEATKRFAMDHRMMIMSSMVRHTWYST